MGSSTVKIVAFAPMPRARVNTAVAVNPGFLRKVRALWATSCRKLSILGNRYRIFDGDSKIHYPTRPRSSIDEPALVQQLIVPKGGHGIDSGSAPRRQVCGSHSRYNQHQTRSS